MFGSIVYFGIKVQELWRSGLQFYYGAGQSIESIEIEVKCAFNDRYGGNNLGSLEGFEGLAAWNTLSGSPWVFPCVSPRVLI